MKQDVKTTSQGKKLFEWDRSQRLLRLKIKKTEYLCELAEDNTFVCIAEEDKAPPPNPPPEHPDNHSP